MISFSSRNDVSNFAGLANTTKIFIIISIGFIIFGVWSYKLKNNFLFKNVESIFFDYMGKVHNEMSIL